MYLSDDAPPRARAMQPACSIAALFGHALPTGCWPAVTVGTGCPQRAPCVVPTHNSPPPRSPPLPITHTRTTSARPHNPSPTPPGTPAKHTHTQHTHTSPAPPPHPPPVSGPTRTWPCSTKVHASRSVSLIFSRTCGAGQVLGGLGGLLGPSTRRADEAKHEAGTAQRLPPCSAAGMRSP